MTRRVLLVVLAAGLATGLVVSAALAHNGSNPRSQGAPGQACKQLERGTEQFRQCVRNAAKQRARGVLRACAAHPRGSAAFRECVRDQIQQRIAQRQARFSACAQHPRGSEARRTCVRTQMQQLKQAIRACKQQHQPGTQAFRDCVRAAVRG